MRQYRAKRKDKPDEWAVGWYAYEPLKGDVILILKHGYSRLIEEEVILETVGQSTGLFDKNGVEIFKGDVTNHGEVCWDELKCQWLIGGVPVDSYATPVEVIGNIHDNPELLNA